MSGVAKMIGAAFAVDKVISAGKAIVSAASDQQQAIGATETVFGKYADSVISKSKKAADQYGLSSTEYQNNANLIASLLKNQGVAQDKLAGSTDKLIGKAADLSATFGGTTKDAVEALSSAYKGEFDPLEKYGISIKQSTVNTEAQAIATRKFHKDLTKLSATQQTALKRQATTNLINKQSAASTGAFAKESDTLAHQQQVLAAKFENIKASLGSALLPVLTTVFAFISDTAIPVVTKWFNAFKQSAFLKNAVATVKNAWTTITGLFSGGGGQAPSFFTSIKDAITNDVIPALKTFWNIIQTQVVPVLKNLGTQVLPVLQQLWQTFKTVFQAIYTVVKFIVGLIAEAWNKFGGQILSAVQGFFSGILLIIRGALQVIQGLANILIGIFTGNWSKAWDGVKQVVAGVWNIIKGIVKAGFNLIKYEFTMAKVILTTVWKVIWNAIRAVLSAAWGGIKSLVSKGIGWVKSIINSGLNAVRGLWNKVWGGVRSSTSSVWNGIKGVLSRVWAGIRAAVRAYFNAYKAVILAVWNGVRSVTSNAWAAIRGVVSGALGRVRSAISGGMSAARSAISGAWSAVRGATATAWAAIKNAVSSGISSAVNVVRGLKGRVLGAVAGAGSWLYGIGQNIVQGLVNGIGSIAGRIEGAVSSIVSKIPSKIRSMMGIASPSRVTRKLGRFISQGLAKGMEDGRAGVTKVVASVTKQIKTELDKRNKATIKAYDAHLKRLGVSYTRRKALEKALDKRLDANTARRIRSTNNEVANLMRNAKKREGVYKRLEAAEKRLADVKKKAADYAASVKQSLIEFGNITNLGDENGVVTTDGIVTSLATKVKKAKDYATLIAKLTKAGLNKTTLNQLIQAGAEGGYDTAKALAQGIGKGAISQVNSLQAQLNKTATAMGNATSKTFYGAGVKAAQGLVNGLKKQQRSLEKWARHLGNSLASAVKKALKIHSPSKVFEEIGLYTVAGLTAGIGDSSQLNKLKGAAGGMTGAIEKGYTQPQLDVAAARGGGNTYQITVHAPVGASSADIGRELTKHISAYERQGGRKRAL